MADPAANHPTRNVLPGTAPEEKIDLLIAALLLSKATSRWKFGEPGSPLDYVHSSARLIMRVHSPYLSVSQAISLGMIICASPTPEAAVAMSAALQECEPAVRDQYAKVSQWLLDAVPCLAEVMPALGSSPQALHLLGGFVDYHARQGRASDIGTIKDNISKWIPTVRIVPEGGDPITFSPNTPEGIFDTDRSNWGWNSPWSARLLVWMSCRKDFDEDVDNFLEGLRHGKIKMDHAGFPAFCYALTGRPFSSDPKEFLDGLLQGAIMLAAYRCVWTSPESSMKPAGMGGGGRGSISRANGIDTVDGGKIAYIACLLRHVLSSETTWYYQNPAVFNGAVFYKNIVKLFEYEAFATPVLRLYYSAVYGKQYAPEPAACANLSEFDRAVAYLEGRATIDDPIATPEYAVAVAAADAADAYNAAAAADRLRNAIAHST